MLKHITLTLLILSMSAFCDAQWIQMPNGLGGTTQALLPVGNNIFAGTYGGGVFLTTNNGANWTAAGLYPQVVYGMAYSGGTLVAGCYIIGIWYTTNNGTNWIQSSYASGGVYAFAVNSNRMFAGTNDGVYISTNNGVGWIQSTLNANKVRALATNGSYIFAGFENNTIGVYLSTDNGIVWTQTTLNNRQVNALTTIGNNIFAGTENFGVYLSTNNGTTWAQTGLSSGIVFALTSSGTSIFAGLNSNPNFYVSTNNGTNWTQRNEGLPEYGIYSLCVLNNYVFAAIYNNGVWRRPLSELVAPSIAPTLISPPNNSTGESLTPRLTFTKVPAATNYQVKVSPDSTFATSVLDTLLTDSTFVIPVGRLTNNVKYYWYARGFNLVGYGPWSAIFNFRTALVGITNKNEVPENFSLSQNYPNPFNPVTVIKFEIPKSAQTLVRIYDVLGREAAVLVNEQLKPGVYEIQWNASNFPSGVYYYEMTAGDFKAVRKMILLK